MVRIAAAVNKTNEACLVLNSMEVHLGEVWGVPRLPVLCHCHRLLDCETVNAICLKVGMGYTDGGMLICSRMYVEEAMGNGKTELDSRRRLESI